MDNSTALKNLIDRLNAGEDFGDVQKDFVEKFSSVSAQEILDAEQQLIHDGTPAAHVQKLCDLHSALFHTPQKNFVDEPDFNSLEDGHPAKTFHLENVALEKFLDELETFDAEKFLGSFKRLFALYAHYGKKEQLFMPILYRHGVTGPSQVMWAVDDEIKRDLRGLAKKITVENFSELKPEISALLKRVREMIFKEEKIFLPMSLRFFSRSEWLAIYRDAPEFGLAFIDDAAKWPAGEEFLKAAPAAEKLSDDTIKFPTGELTLAQLTGILKLLPVDVTFIDAEDTIKFFVNNGGIFARPKSSLGQKVFEYHPPEILPMVRAMLADFKSKKRDRVEIFRNIKGKPTAVIYQAVYDTDGEYLGAVEFVQDFSDALKKF